MSARRKFKRDLIGDTSAREGGALDTVGLAARAAILSRPALLLAALILVSSLLWQEAAMLWALPALWAALFGWQVGRAALRGMSGRHGREGLLMLPDPSTIYDVAAQSMLRRLWQSRQRLESTLDDGPEGTTRDVSRALRGVHELERRSVVLIARVEYVSRFLAGTSLRQVESDLERLQASERRAATTPARLAYQRAVARAAAHLGALQGLEAERDRMLGVLDDMVGALEALPAQVTRLQLLRIEMGDGAAPDDGAETARLLDEIKAVEDAYTGETAATA